MALKSFDSIFEQMPKLPRPMRVVVAGSESENILKGVFSARKRGFAEPVLVGDRQKTMSMLEELGLAGEPCEIVDNPIGTDATVTAIGIIGAGGGDVLMRGNTQTREFLMPILHRKSGLRTNRLMSHVSFASLPGYPKLIALSDITVMVSPDRNKKKEIIRNTVDTLRVFGYQRPKVALLSLVERVSFDIQDSVDAFQLATEHKKTPIADCELVGPVAYDLILSAEAARLKHCDCPFCGDFDAIIAPNLMAGNILVKSWQMHAGVLTCGAVVGAKVPIALTSRSSSEEETFMSIAFCASMMNQMEQ